VAGDATQSTSVTAALVVQCLGLRAGQQKVDTNKCCCQLQPDSFTSQCPEHNSI